MSDLAVLKARAEALEDEAREARRVYNVAPEAHGGWHGY